MRLYQRAAKFSSFTASSLKRTLAVVMVAGLNVNREMVRLGLAWRYEKYSKDVALLAAQNEAKEARRGLWADVSPVPPWEWRSNSNRSP